MPPAAPATTALTILLGCVLVVVCLLIERGSSEDCGVQGRAIEAPKCKVRGGLKLVKNCRRSRERKTRSLSTEYEAVARDRVNGVRADLAGRGDSGVPVEWTVQADLRQGTQRMRANGDRDSFILTGAFGLSHVREAVVHTCT
jgi:hypothetical protein